MDRTKFDLVINLTTAKALGLTIPERFLLRADEVDRVSIAYVRSWHKADQSQRDGMSAAGES